MMSEQHENQINVQRLHPIAMLLDIGSSIKSLIIPNLFLLVPFSSKITFNPNAPENKYFYITITIFTIIILLLLFVIVAAIIRWRKYVYWFEDGEIRVEHGLFVKKKNYIPFERIQSLNYKETIFHRIFKLVKVSLETASDSSESTLELSAVTKEQADQIEKEMKRSKMKVKESTTSAVEYDASAVVVEEAEPKKRVIYTMANKDIILLATTSSSIGILFSGVVALMSQFNDYIPYDAIYEEARVFVKASVFLVVIAVLVVLLLAWIASIVMAYIANYNFQLEEEDNKLFISKGLLEIKRITIPLHRVQGIRIVENPLRQLFGYCRVILDSAGDSGDKTEDNIIILPFVKKKEAIVIVENIFPHLHMQQDEGKFVKAPKKSLIRYLLLPLYIVAIPVAVCSYFLYPYGLFALVLLPILVAMAYAQYRTSAVCIDNKQLTMIYRKVSKVTFLTEKKRIQSMKRKQTVFAERKDIATIRVSIMSGVFGATVGVRHLDKKDVDYVMNWYKYGREKNGRIN